ncbi:hypothetical protein [Serratia fonticola]|uniref:hypothetical protein n=1 Tax=Serratia fonticola TaxID=47917 RepID=UPI001648C1E0|nr:hypothetical protein [Serratia fonticola]MBC3227477.1 hypothetical protein [Serratia fonticola]
MSRGYFNFIPSNTVYAESEKIWWVDLIKTDCFWYDMIINPPNDINTNNIIRSYLKSVEKHFNEHCEKRFIYFLGARKKVRFSTNKKARYSLFKKELTLYLLVGREERKYKIKYSFYKVTSNGKYKITPKVRVTEKYLYIKYESENIAVLSDHDFLKDNYIDLKINTEIHYVGYTHQPHKRPVDLIHRGLSKMLYNVSNDDNDFFVYFSIFNPRAISHNDDYNVSFNISNSLMNEIEVDKEGRVIENCFIRYFDTKIQDDDKESKRSDLNNMFTDLVKKKRIKSIAVNLQYESSNEYFCFYSRSVVPQNDHFFVIDFVDEKINLDRNKDLAVHMQLIMDNSSY